MMSAERGASVNTIAAYRRDLLDFCAKGDAKPHRTRRREAVPGLARVGGDIAVDTGAQIVVAAAVLRLPLCGRHPQGRPDIGDRRAQARAQPAEGPVARRCRCAHRDGAPGRGRRRPAPGLHRRDALCGRLTRQRAGRASVRGSPWKGRFPADQGQGQQGAARPAGPVRTRHHRRLSRRPRRIPARRRAPPRGGAISVPVALGGGFPDAAGVATRC